MKTITLILQDNGDIAIYEGGKRVYFHKYWMGESLEENKQEALEFLEKTYGKDYTLTPLYADMGERGYLFNIN